MDLTLFTNLLDPPILFFFFGIFAVLIKSNLEIPQALSKFFSLYMLMAIGIKGGAALSATGINQEMVRALLAGVLMSALVPAYSFLILRTRLNAYNAAAIAATYGSVSVVTFIAAGSFLDKVGIGYGEHMIAALVLMESPAIVMAVLLSNVARSRERKHAGEDSQAQNGNALPMGKILHEAFTDGTHLMLIGSLLIGMMTGAAGKTVMEPFTAHIFKGLLAFFLLDMGLLVGNRIREMKDVGLFLVGFGLFMPVINAVIGMALGKFLGLPQGDAFLLMVLSASASYIAVPAVVRYAIPEANPSLYFTLALAVTFPFNIVFGIPLYLEMVKILWR